MIYLQERVTDYLNKQYPKIASLDLDPSFGYFDCTGPRMHLTDNEKCVSSSYCGTQFDSSFYLHIRTQLTMPKYAIAVSNIPIFTIIDFRLLFSFNPSFNFHVHSGTHLSLEVTIRTAVQRPLNFYKT